MQQTHHERVTANSVDLRKRIMKAACDLSEKEGYTNVRRNDIAALAGVGNGSVNNLVGDMPDLRDEIMRHAVETENLTIIAQGLTIADPIARAADIELKQRALLAMV
jgi:AcrR family transcriptional regulator